MQLEDTAQQRNEHRPKKSGLAWPGLAWPGSKQIAARPGLAHLNYAVVSPAFWGNMG